MKKFRYCDLILYLYYQVIHEKQFYCYRSLVDCRLAHLSLFELQSIKIILKKFEDKATDIHRFYTINGIKHVTGHKKCHQVY